MCWEITIILEVLSLYVTHDVAMYVFKRQSVLFNKLMHQDAYYTW
jgi:hypothetical protein